MHCQSVLPDTNGCRETADTLLGGIWSAKEEQVVVEDSFTETLAQSVCTH